MESYLQKRPLRGCIVGLLFLAATGCADAPIPPPPSVAPSPVVIGLSIGTDLTLTTIGETKQLVATATLTGNTTRDITREGTWNSNDRRVIDVSASGFMTVVGFGASAISFTYQRSSASIIVTASPEGTFVIRGRVREPGTGAVNNVVVVDTLSGRTATTDITGVFSLAELRQLEANLRVEHPSYEPIEIHTTAKFADLPVQRVVRLNAGETITAPAVAPNDLVYDTAGGRCYDCRLVRIVVGGAGTVHIRVTWKVNTRLSLFAEGQVVTGQGQELDADVPFASSREMLVYVGATASNVVGNHTPFTLETSLR
jgi:hypothetical protein